MNDFWNEIDFIGQPLDRVDGRLKVTGKARYAAEFAPAGLLHGSLVQSTIAQGTVTRLDVSAAEHAPGVIAVITPDNMPDMAPPKPPAGESNPLLAKKINYSGQNIALVVAETLEEAEFAASLVAIEYESNHPEVVMSDHLDKVVKPPSGGRGGPSVRGDIAAGIAAATTKLDAVYTTPVEHHNPMEPHATVAVWDGDKVTAYDSTQGVSGSAQNIANQCKVPVEQVQVIDPFVGGGFGCKGQSWPHAPIAAMAARVVKRPVKIAITRKQMFSSNGHRPDTRQEMSLGATADGRLTALRFHGTNHTSRLDTFVEPTGSPSSMAYSCPNVAISQDFVRLDVGAPTYMRAPGESSGSFGLETAMDEMAVALNLDPIEFRLRNYADKDERSGRPWSSKSLKECYAKGAEVFGWSKINRQTSSLRSGRLLVGYGMAGATYPANYRPASAYARINKDGSALIKCGTQDLGTGTYTILTQLAADALGVLPSKVTVEIADSHLPKAPGSGGSTSAASAGSAVYEAAMGLRRQVAELITAQPDNPLSGALPTEIKAKEGRLIAPSTDGPRALTYSEALTRLNKDYVEHETNMQQPLQRINQQPGGQPRSIGYSSHGFGAQFCEVHVDPDLGMIRVARWVGAFAVGTVLNAKTLRSQLQGGIVWGIGMGLLEASVIDPTYGRFLNSNLAEYHVPVNKDAPPIEIILIPEKDEHVNPIGVKGAGEIGITGAAAAIGNAVFHATGKRIRDLPITLDKLL